MKRSSRRARRLTASALCAAVLVAAACSLPALHARLTRGSDRFRPARYQGILVLYSVDTFEGGVGSRAEFLLSRAAEFEKMRNGVLISVETHTPDSLAERVRGGAVPDAISFGPGAEIPSPVVLGEGADGGGALGGKVYAEPWCRGAYCILTKGGEETESAADPERLIASKGAFNQPLVALAAEGIRAECEEMAPLDAYAAFLSGSRPLLGTQRDVNRLDRRGVEYAVRPLGAFCDLFQYYAVTARTEARAAAAREFLEYLRSDACQEKLSAIGMLPVTDCRVYREDGGMRRLEDACRAPALTLSAFTSASVLAEIAAFSRAAIAGDGEKSEKIRELLVPVCAERGEKICDSDEKVVKYRVSRWRG